MCELDAGDSVRRGEGEGPSSPYPVQFRNVRFPDGLEGAHLPLRLVVPWIIHRDRDAAEQAWNESYLARRPIILDRKEYWGWEDLKRELVHGHLRATGLNGRGVRVDIEPRAWLDLEPIVQGSSDHVAWRSTRTIVYSGVLFDRREVIRLWPSDEASSRGTSTIGAERRAEQALCDLIKTRPENPIAKSVLRARNEFKLLSERGFNRAYANAARRAGASAWTAPGRRPKSRDEKGAST